MGVNPHDAVFFIDFFKKILAATTSTERMEEGVCPYFRHPTLRAISAAS